MTLVFERNMRRTSTNLGFTLMELLLVLLIIAVVASIAAPTLSGFTRGRVLPNTAGNLVTTARWCRVQALVDSTTYHLNIDISGRRWWVTKDDGTGNFVPVNGDYGKEYILPDGVDFQGPIMFQSQISVSDGTFVPFDSLGKTEVVTITLAADNHVVVVGCDTPLGSFHIVPGAVQ